MAEGSEARGRAQPARADDPGAGGCRLWPAWVAIAALGFERGKGGETYGVMGSSLASLSFSLLVHRWHD